MMVEKFSIKIPKSISNLTDAEFLSFLYSERDREQSLRTGGRVPVSRIIGVSNNQ